MDLNPRSREECSCRGGGWALAVPMGSTQQPDCAPSDNRALYGQGTTSRAGGGGGVEGGPAKRASLEALKIS